ncbi:60S acidic ribosomal protein family, partial [Prunus dulcis]
ISSRALHKKNWAELGWACLTHISWLLNLWALVMVEPTLGLPNNQASPFQLMSVSELACTYAALVLHDDGIPITAEKIATLVKAANVTVESYWPGLFAKLAEKRNIEDLILNVGAGGGGGAVAVAAPGAGAAAPAAAPAAEEKKEEPKEESDDDMGFSLNFFCLLFGATFEIEEEIV